MIQLQVISKVLQSKSMDLLDINSLTPDYFVGYEEEINFIFDHFREFGNVPDKATFLSKFPDLELVEVTESDKYLVDTLKEEYLYYKSIPVVEKIAELLKTDANAAAEYMIQATKELEPDYGINSIDIISQADKRYEEYELRKDRQEDWFFTTGFQELDDILHGLQRGEELLVLVARVNQGKSWVLEKICTHIWQIGYNVGYISPEMGASSIGYRFDTLKEHYSNKALTWGNDIDTSYADYIDELKESKNKFLVATPTDFQRVITISKLRNWVRQQKLDILAIDGITYMTDERYRKGDNKTTSLTNISEDLMSLSIELCIPIIVVVQANRGAVQDNKDAAPELEHIRDSDGIAHNASKVISIRKLKNQVLRMEIKKQRFGVVGGKLDYTWDIDKGDFQFLPNYEDAEPDEETEKKTNRMKKKFNDKEDVF